MVSVELLNIRMHANHGMYEGEDKTGSDYEINLVIKFDEGSSKFENLNETVSYADLYEIVKIRMKVKTPLLERVAEGIIRRIKHQYPRTREVRLSIYKLQAPVENFQGKMGVTIHKHFDD